MLGETEPLDAAPLEPQTGGAAAIPRRGRSRYSILTRRDKTVMALMVGVPTFLCVTLIWLPTIASIGLSFTNWRGITPLTDQNLVGLKNYVTLFTTYPFFWPAVIHHEPQDVVDDRGPEERVRREERHVVLQPDEVLVSERRDSAPVREREPDRRDRRQPNQGDAEKGRDPDHQGHHRLVATGQDRVAAPTSARNGSRPTGLGFQRGGVERFGLAQHRLRIAVTDAANGWLGQRRERLPEVLDRLLVGGQILGGVGKELLEETLHAVRPGEVGAGVAIEELGDPSRLADDLDRLLLERRVRAGVGVLGRRDQ